jgi:hypothetical protein
MGIEDSLGDGVSMDDFLGDGFLDRFMANLDRIDRMKVSDEGKYRVVGLDKFSNEDWVQGEYPTAQEALDVAREHTRECRRDSTDYSIATVFFAYDPEGKYLGGAEWTSDWP